VCFGRVRIALSRYVEHGIGVRHDQRGGSSNGAPRCVADRLVCPHLFCGIVDEQRGSARSRCRLTGAIEDGVVDPQSSVRSLRLRSVALPHLFASVDDRLTLQTLRRRSALKGEECPVAIPFVNDGETRQVSVAQFYLGEVGGIRLSHGGKPNQEYRASQVECQLAREPPTGPV